MIGVNAKYQELCKDMLCSYSDKGTPYDNACIESFHELIKREWLNPHNILNYQQTYTLVFKYMEAFYNAVRIHSHCDYVSVNEYIKQFEKANN
ncbi:MAG: integrase core domain-containing protein [Breznakia sp.]